MKLFLVLLLTLCALVIASCQNSTNTIIRTTTETRTVATTQLITTTQLTILPTTTTKIVTVTCNNTSIPIDFYVIYEVSRGSDDFMTILDTEKNIIGKDLGNAYGRPSYTSRHFEIPCNEIRALYDALIEYDILSLCNPDLVISTDSPWPAYWHKISFRLDGVMYSILIDDQVKLSLDHPNIAAFKRVLTTYIFNTDEYKSFPPSAPPGTS